MLCYVLVLYRAILDQLLRLVLDLQVDAGAGAEQVLVHNALHAGELLVQVQVFELDLALAQLVIL